MTKTNKIIRFLGFFILMGAGVELIKYSPNLITFNNYWVELITTTIGALLIYLAYKLIRFWVESKIT